jgi:hypothetical protein
MYKQFSAPISMENLDLKKVQHVMVSVAYDAGIMILSANPANIDTDTKLNCTASCPPSLAKPFLLD